MLAEKQKEAVSKFLSDVAKIVLAVFVVGGLVPGSPITNEQLVIAIFDIFVIFSIGIWLLKEAKNG